MAHQMNITNEEVAEAFKLHLQQAIRDGTSVYDDGDPDGSGCVTLSIPGKGFVQLEGVHPISFEFGDTQADWIVKEKLTLKYDKVVRPEGGCDGRN